MKVNLNLLFLFIGISFAGYLFQTELLRDLLTWSFTTQQLGNYVQNFSVIGLFGFILVLMEIIKKQRETIQELQNGRG